MIDVLLFPPSYYGKTIDDSESITGADFAICRAGDYSATSLRIGQRTGMLSSLTLSVSDSYSLATWTVSPNEISLSDNEVSDTITLSVELALEATDGSHDASLVVTSDTGESWSFDLTYESVGANSERRSQYPRRTGPSSETFAGVIERLGQPVTVHRYEPIAYDPEDRRVFMIDGKPVGQSVCERLNPSNTRWGYQHSQQTIVGVVSREHWQTRETFVRDDTSVSYSGSLRLTFPAEDELTRSWALFSPARGADTDQFKRTVYIIKYEGRYWGLQNIESSDFGDQLAAFGVNLIPIQTEDMGAPSFYNPFALTYRRDSDQPYACFPCGFEFSIEESVSEASGSMNPSIDDYNPSAYSPPAEEEPEEPETPTLVNDYAMQFDSASNYIGIHHVGALPIYRTTGYSVSLWVNLSSAAFEMILSESAEGLSFWGIMLNGTSLIVWVPDYVQKVSTVTVADGAWHHIVWTDNAGDAHLWIDGTEDVGTDYSHACPAKTWTRTTIGANRTWAPAETLITPLQSGDIDEISAYSRVLTDAEIASLYNAGSPSYPPESGLIGWWRMGDGATWNGDDWLIPDESGGGNHAVSEGMTYSDRVAGV